MHRSTKRKGRVVSRDSIEHVRIVRPARGGTYYYFKTGQVNPAGKPILKRMPDIDDPEFWSTYAAYRAALTKRANQKVELTLAGLIELYQKSERWRKLAANSQARYDIYLRNLIASFGESVAANSIERRDVVTLIDSMADRPGAANFQLSVTSALFSWGRSRGHVDVRPCDDIDAMEMGEHQPWPDALLTAALGATDPVIKLAVHLLYYTGQRIGDVCMMRWSDYSNGRIEIVQEKTGARVSIPPHPDLAKLLGQTSKAGLTILARDGRPFDRQMIRKYLKDFASERGFKIVPHGLRKNAVNALLEAGCSAAETAAITRQSLGMVEHYAKGRDNKKMADAAILKWSKIKGGTGKQ